MNPGPVGTPGARQNQAKPPTTRRKATQAADCGSLYDIETAELANLLKSCDRLQWNPSVLGSISPDDTVETRPKQGGVMSKLLDPNHHPLEVFYVNEGPTL